MVTSPQASGFVRLSYREDKPGYKQVIEEISSFDQLIKRLYEIQASRVSDLFIGVNLEDASDNELAIGLGDGIWALVYTNPQHTQQCYSMGNTIAEGDLELRFEQWEVLPKKYFIPVEKATEVMHTWFTTGELSKDIQWERVSLLSDGN